MVVTILASLAIGYACGMFLTADVVCHVACGKSAFETGVGNPGMANVGHELGVKWAGAVLAGDIGKTLLAWLVCRALFPADAATAGVMAGLGATLGHNYPAWHHFSGGKGVTTTCSAIFLTNPALGLLACLAGLFEVLFCGYLCVGAIVISATWLVLSVLFGDAYQIVVAVALLVLMVIAHGGPTLGIRDGSTGKASISERFHSLLRGKRRDEAR